MPRRHASRNQLKSFVHNRGIREQVPHYPADVCVIAASTSANIVESPTKLAAVLDSAIPVSEESKPVERSPQVAIAGAALRSAQ